MPFEVVICVVVASINLNKKNTHKLKLLIGYWGNSTSQKVVSGADKRNISDDIVGMKTKPYQYQNVKTRSRCI